MHFSRETERHSLPGIKLHKASRQLYIRLDDRLVYLGKEGTDAVLPAYLRIVGEWLANDRTPPKPRRRKRKSSEPATTVREITELYFRDYKVMDALYSRARSELSSVRKAVRLFVALYGDTPANTVTTTTLKVFVWALRFEGITTKMAVDYKGRIVRILHWAERQKLLRDGNNSWIAFGRYGHDIDFAVPFDRTELEPGPGWSSYVRVLHVASPTIRAMLLLQRALGLHPAEVVSLRVGDFRPDSDSGRLVTTPYNYDCLRDATDVMMPRCRHTVADDVFFLVQPFRQGRKDSEYLFSPRQAMWTEAIDAHQSRAVASMLNCTSDVGQLLTSHSKRPDVDPATPRYGKVPDHYTPRSYAAEVSACVVRARQSQGCFALGVYGNFEPWFANQLWQPRSSTRTPLNVPQRIDVVRTSD